jgi:hypothetical protein
LVGNTTLTVETFPNSLDISESFESLEPIECPLTGFKIDRIVNNAAMNTTEKIPEKIASINKAGLVTISIQEPKDIYHVYIQASNVFNGSYSTEELVLILNQTSDLPPYFVSKLDEQVFELSKSSGTKEVFKYQFPA